MSDNENKKQFDINKFISQEVVPLGKDILVVADSTEHLNVRVEAFLGICKKLASPVRIAASTIELLGTSISGTLKYAQEGAQMSSLVKQSGIASEKFQALANASKKYGGSVEDTAKSLSILGTNLRDVQKGGDGNGLKNVFSAFNINPAGIKSMDDFFNVIAGRMESLSSDAEKMDFGKALGLNPAMIEVFCDGIGSMNKELEDSKKYQLFTPDDMERASELSGSLVDIGLGLEKIVSNITHFLLPILTPVFEIIKNIVDFFAYNSEVIQLLLVTVASCITYSLLPAIGELLTALLPFIGGWLLLGVAIFFVFGAIGQFLKWLKGEKSIFDKWFGDFETFKTGIISGFKQIGKNISDFCKKLAKKIKDIFFVIVDYVKLVLKKLLDYLPGWLTSFLKNGGSIGLLIKGIGVINEKRKESEKNGSHANGLGYVPFDGYMAELHKGESVLTSSETNALNGLISGKRAIAETSNVPIASMSLGSITGAYSNNNSTRNFTIGDITIQTAATDADGIASELMHSIKMAFNGLDTGVQA